MRRNGTTGNDAVPQPKVAHLPAQSCAHAIRLRAPEFPANVIGRHCVTQSVPAKNPLAGLLEFGVVEFDPDGDEIDRPLSRSAALGCFQKGRLDGRRNVDRDEAIRREQVILTALVDDAEVAVLLGILVRQDDVDLVTLERGFVAVVVDADGELAVSRGCFA